MRAALEAAKAGADGITAHLREDRRHIRDEDIARLMAEITLPLNLEMAATEEMVALALKSKPHAACIVPEKREERTTEGGLEVTRHMSHLKACAARLTGAGIRVSFFINPARDQVEAAKEAGAQVVELHTGRYCEEQSAARQEELKRIQEAAAHAADLGLECHAGHGLGFDTVAAIAAIPQVAELNIGHFLVGEAIFLGWKESIHRIKFLMEEARA